MDLVTVIGYVIIDNHDVVWKDGKVALFLYEAAAQAECLDHQEVRPCDLESFLWYKRLSSPGAMPEGDS